MKFKTILTIFTILNSVCAQNNWQLCCKGYEAGYQKGFTYPEMMLSSTAAPPPCGCFKIVGGQTYDAGFAVGFEDGRIAKMARIDNQNNLPKSDPQKTQFETNNYVPAIPFADFQQGIYEINIRNQITLDEINKYIKYRDSRQQILIRECDIKYYVQEITKINEAVDKLFKSGNYTSSQKLNQYIEWIKQFETDDLILDMLNNSRLYSEIYLSVETYKQSRQDVGFNKKLESINMSIDASTAYGFALFNFYRKIIQWKNNPSIYASLENEKLTKSEFLRLMNEFNSLLPKKNGCFAGNCKNGYGVFYEWGFDWQEVSKFQKYPYKTIEGYFKNGLKNGVVTTTFRNIKTGLPVTTQTAIFRNDTILEILVGKCYKEGKLTNFDSSGFYMTYLDDNRKFEFEEEKNYTWLKTTIFKNSHYYRFENRNKKPVKFYPAYEEPKEGFAYSLKYNNGNGDTSIYYCGGFGKFNSQVMFWENHGIGTVINDDGNRDTRIWNHGDQVIDTLRIFENIKNNQVAPEYKIKYYSKECIGEDPSKYTFFYFIKDNKVYRYYFADNRIIATSIPLNLFLKRFDRLIKHRSKYFKL